MKTKLLKEEVCVLLNKAIEQEMFASNMYKHIANNLQSQGFFGAQKYFIKESKEELKHYQIIVNYLNDMGDMGKVPTIPSMTEKVNGIGGALKIAFDQEVALMKFYSSACEKVDAVTYQFLLQFIEIQRKSVGEYMDLLTRFEMISNDSCGQLIFDKELDGL